jgi:hypothetical protein
MRQPMIQLDIVKKKLELANPARITAKELEQNVRFDSSAVR